MSKTILCLVLAFTVLMHGCAVSEHAGKERSSAMAPVWTPGTDVEAFWMQYAKSRGGLTWGPSADYPEYARVKEGDTFMVQLEQGPCLMEFFHSRWRLANDVRRWDSSINAYGGCPYVFD